MQCFCGLQYTLFVVVVVVVFFLTCEVIKKWFELSRLNFTNCLKANENYFELAGVSSYQEFELWEVDCIAIPH